MTLRIPGIPRPPSLRLTTVLFSVTEPAYVQTVKAWCHASCPPVSHFTHAPHPPAQRADHPVDRPVRG